MSIQIGADELEPLRSKMRDLQVGASRYYAQTATSGETAATVRAFIADCQILNELLEKSIADSSSYKALFVKPAHAGVALIEGIKYVRNVASHVLHIVKPSNTVTLVGGDLGHRIYAPWEEIPLSAHDKLQKGTKLLRPQYVANLQGKEVMSTMMGALRFFAEVAPALVHRDRYGEWTGFPLMSQPGMPDPLHPEEPRGSYDEKRAWLNSRRPNGDARVICGQVTIDQVHYLFGFTFIGRLSFTPFHETVEQINADIAAGFPYLAGEFTSNVIDVTDKHPDARQGHVFESQNELSSWTTVVTGVDPGKDWCMRGLDEDGWHLGTRIELERGPIEGMAYGVRRARRLNAIVPPNRN